MRLGSFYRWLVLKEIGGPTVARRALDVGCHDGFFLSHLEAKLRVGIDLAPARKPFFPVFPADASHLPFRDGTFDLVSAFDLLEHLCCPQAALREMYRVLDVGGTLWLSVPARGFRIFPPFLTAWCHQRWGHTCPGYGSEEIRAFLPQGATLHTIWWNEPLLRSMYFGLRLLWEAFPWLVRRVCALMVKAEKKMARGVHGHLFLAISKDRY